MPRDITIDVQLQQFANRMCISYFRGIFMHYRSKKFVKNESGIIKSEQYRGTHAIAYAKRGNRVMYFSFGNLRSLKELMNSMEIDRNRNVTIKNYVSMTYKLWLPWTQNGTLDPIRRKDTLIFPFNMPLNMLLGFCEDYKRVIANARYELILIWVRNYYNCLVGNPVTEPEIELFKVQWWMLHVALNKIKLSMLWALDCCYLSMSFRS